ncbi:hypothetical protein HZY88_08455 [Aerococcaceae bacterium DSM 111176]|nr:hypothetical protein [Aerococcaceae bacterium DSM 111176]
MEWNNNLEAKDKILTYIQLPDKIECLKSKKQLISKQFYASCSMTGTMPIGDLEENNYNRSISPEYGAIVIADSEAIIQCRIDRASKKWALFNELMPFLDSQRLMADQQLYYVTELEQQALEAINEVEYYLTEHQKTKERLKGYGLDQEQQAQMKEAGNTLLNRIKELAL